MDNYPPTAWARLGKILEHRRGQLGYGFRMREKFAFDRGGLVSAKTLQRLEHGQRDSYPAATVGAVETMYQWAPGSIESVLAGGDPVPLEDVLDEQPDPDLPEDRTQLRRFLEDMGLPPSAIEIALEMADDPRISLRDVLSSARLGMDMRRNGGDLERRRA